MCDWNGRSEVKGEGVLYPLAVDFFLCDCERSPLQRVAVVVFVLQLFDTLFYFVQFLIEVAVVEEVISIGHTVHRGWMSPPDI